MPFDGVRLVRFQVGMRKRIEELRHRTDDCLDVAMDSMMQDRVDSYFRVEEGLQEIERTLILIEEELGAVHDVSSANRLESRLEFMEDRFEEFDSEVRQRPRRRRRRINLADFFKAAGGAGSMPAGRGEVTTVTEAFRILDLEYGSLLTAVTAAFRRRAKALHPDARKGDRSAEPELRRIIEAYQLLKEHLGAVATEPPPNFSTNQPSHPTE
jgi:hypothetical protein